MSYKSKNDQDNYRRDSNKDDSSSKRQDHKNDARNRRRSRSPQTNRHDEDRTSRRRDYSDDRERYGHRQRHYEDGNRSCRGRDSDTRYDRRRNVGERNDFSATGRPSWENNKVRRHAEEIQQRKLLWSKPKEGADVDAEAGDSNAGVASSSGAPAPKVLESAWTSRLAAATADSKQMDKFQRLMGMKKSSGAEGDDQPSSNPTESNEAGKASLELERQRQAELTAQLDRQYAMARATTHLGRGKGLGFNG